ncbi:MAG: DUF2807 domain-containing protein [Bacteroidales bacterium]|nr:DUF2807 domain-containing protein [Bacteroidales bacterium]
MKQLIAPIFMALGVMTLGAQSLSRYELDVKEFSELKVTDGVNVDYKCMPDSAGKAVFVAPASTASAIMFEPSKGRLNVRLASEAPKTGLPTVTVYSSYLTYVENDGDSTVRVLSVAPGPKFKAKVVGNGRLVVRNVETTTLEGSLDTGNGTVVLYGTTTEAKLSMTGSGNIQADDLKAQNVKAKLLGTGSISCWPEVKLSVSPMSAGSGTIYYRGTPEVKKKGLGIKVVALDEAR